MKYGNKAKGLGLNGSQYNMKNRKENIVFLRRFFANKSILFYLITVGLAIILSAESANAAYVVQPGMYEFILKPRERVVTELKLHNSDTENSAQLNIELIELTQKEDGIWLPINTDPCDPFDYYEGMDLSKLSSCSSWINMDETSVEIIPNGDVQLEVKINVPPRTSSGFYAAMIMVSNKVKGEEGALIPDMILRTGVPVIVNVQTRPMRPVVEILDLDMEYVPASGDNPAKTLATMRITNKGKTFPRLWPIVRIRGYLGGHSRLIATHEFDEIGIIPDVELNLKSDIGKNLPSGTYQLESVLYVEGRIAGKFGKEIEYVGDPKMTKVATDVPLDLVPEEAIIETAPGSTHYTNIKVHNAADENITIQPIIGVPECFKNKATSKGVIVADSMTPVEWLTIEPQTLELSGYDTRNLRILSQMPEDAVQFPNYYASLGLKATYADGQAAGTEWINVCVANKNIFSEPKIECGGIQIIESDAEKSEYQILAGFYNDGKAHIIPRRCRAAFALSDGFSRASTLMISTSNKSGMFLPYENRIYTGVIDCSNLDAINHRLEIKLEYGTDMFVKKQIATRIVDVGGRRVPEIIDNNIKIDDIIEVNW